MEKKWKLNPRQKVDLIWWIVKDGRRPLAVHGVNYNRTEGSSLGETSVTHWRIDSVRISSPPPLVLTLFHWRHSIFLWTLSNFCSGTSFRLIQSTHTHTHISRLTLSFPLRHLTTAATTTVSHSRSFFPSSRLPRCLFSFWHLGISTLSSLSTRLMAWQSVCVCPFVRHWSYQPACHIE